MRGVYISHGEGLGVRQLVSKHLQRWLIHEVDLEAFTGGGVSAVFGPADADMVQVQQAALVNKEKHAGGRQSMVNVLYRLFSDRRLELSTSNWEPYIMPAQSGAA